MASTLLLLELNAEAVTHIASIAIYTLLIPFRNKNNNSHVQCRSYLWQIYADECIHDTLEAIGLITNPKLGRPLRDPAPPPFPCCMCVYGSTHLIPIAQSDYEKTLRPNRLPRNPFQCSKAGILQYLRHCNAVMHVNCTMIFKCSWFTLLLCIPFGTVHVPVGRTAG